MSDTPISDAVAREACDDTGCLCRPEILWASHADLERQLAEAREQIEKMNRWTSVNGVLQLQRQLAEARDTAAHWKQEYERVYEQWHEDAKLIAEVEQQRDRLANAIVNAADILAALKGDEQ